MPVFREVGVALLLVSILVQLSDTFPGVLLLSYANKGTICVVSFTLVLSWLNYLGLNIMGWYLDDLHTGGEASAGDVVFVVFICVCCVC